MVSLMTNWTLCVVALAGMFLFGVSQQPRATVRISEIVACNHSLLRDEQGEFEDYVRLNNTGTAAIELGGMYLSDDWDQPRQWQIPPGTTLLPGESLIVWADAQPGDGPYHATFRLNAASERVLLFAADQQANVMLDEVSFVNQRPDQPLFRK